MTTKFNIGDRVVVSNPTGHPQVQKFVGQIGKVEGCPKSVDPYRVKMEGYTYNTLYLYANELTHVEE